MCVDHVRNNQRTVRKMAELVALKGDFFFIFAVIVPEHRFVGIQLGPTHARQEQPLGQPSRCIKKLSSSLEIDIEAHVNTPGYFAHAESA